MPGLIRGVARTAVIAGTATAVSNGVSRRQVGRWQRQEAEQQASAQQAQQAAAYQQMQYDAQRAAAQAPAQPEEDPTIAKLKDLAALHSQGILSDEEFASAKAKLLGV